MWGFAETADIKRTSIMTPILCNTTYMVIKLTLNILKSKVEGWNQYIKLCSYFIHVNHKSYNSNRYQQHWLKKHSWSCSSTAEWWLFTYLRPRSYLCTALQEKCSMGSQHNYWKSCFPMQNSANSVYRVMLNSAEF